MHLSKMNILSFQNVGIDKGDIPDLTKAPSSLLDALEGHLATVEGRKTSAANTPTQSSRLAHYNKNRFYILIEFIHTRTKLLFYEFVKYSQFTALHLVHTGQPVMINIRMVMVMVLTNRSNSKLLPKKKPP